MRDMRNVDAARAESQRAIESVYLETRGLVRLASDIRERHEAAQSRLVTLQADAPASAAVDAGHRVVAAVLPAVLASIFVVEWLLAAPTAEWFSVILLGSPGWVPTLRSLLPTSVFLLEVLLSVQIHEESDRRRDGRGSVRPLVLGAILLVVMPLFSVATQIAILPDEPELMAMFWARTAALVLLAFVLHGTVLASGRLIRESLGWWCFTVAFASRRARAGLLRRKDRRVTTAALKTFTIYRRLHAKHNSAWAAEALEFGPWDSVAHVVIGEDLAASASAAQPDAAGFGRGLGHRAPAVPST